jgi:hypothetical protein
MYRPVFVDKHNILYLNGKPYKEKTVIYFVEPSPPQENDLWYCLEDEILYIWRPDENGEYSWQPVNDLARGIMATHLFPEEENPDDLQTFDFHFNMVENGEGSMLASVAGWIAPIFRPIGLGEWQIVTALVSGFMAKESVVATLEVLDAMPLFTTITSISMLVFCLLYTPCVAAVAAIRRELGTKWMLFIILFQCAVAWICAWFAYLIANAVIA